MSSPEPRGTGQRGRRSRALRVVGSVVYWLAVLVIVLVLGLVLLLESRDQSEIEGEGGARAAPNRTDAYTGFARCSRPNTTIRCAALYSGWQAVSTSRSWPTRRVTSVAVGGTIICFSTR
jgi:hypothetical protein